MMSPRFVVTGIVFLAMAGSAQADPAAVLRPSAQVSDSSAALPDSLIDRGASRPGETRFLDPEGFLRSHELDDEADLADSSRVHFELGARADVTNESYYEDAFVDTTFLGRKLVNTPEKRLAGVVVAAWNGTRGFRASRYSLLSELSAGDLLQRGSATLQWRSPLATDWTLHLNPSVEYRHDRTFDRDLEEWRASAAGRVRRDFADGMTGAEVGLRGDLLRASGLGSDFLLDRNSAAISGAVDHLGLTGDEWRLGYSLTGRVFPDSSERDHVEHGLEGRLHWAGNEARPAVSIEALATRRRTLDPASTSRDNYWDMEAGVDTRFANAEHWPVTAALDGELFRYDAQDSILYFDYAIARASAALHWEPEHHWSVALGPAAEVLNADLDPGESYQEIGGVLEIERLGIGSWWSANVASGWRDYDPTPAAGPNTPPLHSSFAFHQLELTADQPLGGHLKGRLLAIVRWELHQDQAQDAVSVYLTSELRWLP